MINSGVRIIYQWLKEWVMRTHFNLRTCLKTLALAILALCSVLTATYMINGHPSNPPAPFAESMSEQDIQGLKEGQKILLEMFHVFDRICRRHNITYWCTGGTLIGAVSSNQASTPHKLVLNSLRRLQICSKPMSCLAWLSRNPRLKNLPPFTAIGNGVQCGNAAQYAGGY